MKKSLIHITVEGIRPIIFDRFVTMDTKKIVPIEDKVYKNKDGNLILPAKNIMSFLTSVNSESAPQRLLGRTWRTVAKAAMSFVNITELEIPILRDGAKTVFEDCIIVEDKAVVKKAGNCIPSPKVRPMLELPWTLSWTMDLFGNNDLDEKTLKKLFEEGGITIGFGTYRGLYGKFIVTEWTVS